MVEMTEQEQADAPPADKPPAKRKAAPARERIVLRMPLTHRNADYAAGETLSIAAIQMTAADANWLVGVGGARWV